jgi:membrane protease YdiL (CAAX protease family)
LRFLALDSRHPARDLALGFSLGGLAVALNVGVYALAGWYHVQSLQLDLGPFLVGGLGGYFLVGFGEELLLRGILFRVLEVALGSIAALALSSLLFGLLHLGNPGATLLGAVTSAAGGGVVFGTAYMLTRSLWLAIGLHWAADFWQGSFFGLRAAGTTMSHPLLHSTLTGPQLWIGDKFGGRLVALAIFVPIMAGLLVVARRRGCFRPAPERLRTLVARPPHPSTKEW